MLGKVTSYRSDIASCKLQGAYVQGVDVDVDRLILTYYNIYYSTVLNV